MDDLIAFGKALADPTRLRILNALLQSELCVCELVDALQVSQSSLSTQLQTLRSAGIVQTEKRRTWIIYSITEKFQEPLRQVARCFPTDDPRVSADNERLDRRLRLRVEGCCVQGIGALEPERAGVAG